MPIASSADLVEALHWAQLLEPAQLNEVTGQLQARFPEPYALADELVRRGWLTAYQVGQIFVGHEQDLVLGNYLVLERLGEGGMGTVFKARHRKLGRIVALKRIRKECLSNPDAVRRFQREARAVAQLTHPNIVLAYDADQAGDDHFLVFEYVEGTDLGKLVRERGPLPVAHACDFVAQAARGLQHAFEKGLVHRDIKPSNLILTNSGVVKVLDLGLARLASAETLLEQPTTLTQEGAVMGTPDFIAPEQARDCRSADIRADVYSLGCTLYFLLTGSAPFPGGSLTEKLLKHQLDAPTPLRSLRTEVPPAVAVVVAKMMTKRPEERFQAPAEVAAALAAAQPSTTQTAKQETNTVQSRDQAQGARDIVAPSEPAKRGGRRLLIGGVGALALLAVLLVWWMRRERAVTPAPVGAPKDRVRLLVPAYFYPAGEGLAQWDTLIASHNPDQGVEIVAIVNIDSGRPGARANPDYARIIARAADKGLRLIAYVRTDYGNRNGHAPLDATKKAITDYFDFYPKLSGVFLDEQATEASFVPTYYAPLRQYVLELKPDALVVTNPGRICDEAYLSNGKARTVADVVVMCENKDSAGPLVNYAPPKWAANYPPERFGALIHGCPEPMQNLDRIRARRIGYVHVTDKAAPPEGENAWDRLPRYWGEEVQRIKELNR
jgi:serine/threonine-protein kinase